MDPVSTGVVMNRWLMAAGIAVSVLCAQQVQAQDAQPWQEYGKKVSTAQTVTALDGGSFGQTVSLYDGSTSFAATDISILGNNALPVALGRRYAVEDRFQMTYLGGFGNWDIDIPHIEGTFSSAHGWVVGPPNAANRNSRCSVQQVPYIGNSSFDPEDIWSGYRVHVPGMDGEEMLKVIPGAHGAPADGQSYPWTTASQGRLKCLATLQAGYPGEGFELVTPEGLRYRFDKVVERTIRPIKKPVMGALTRKRIYLLVSRVQDRYGNWVNYSYSGDKLQSISSSDGRSITLTWSGEKVSSAATNGRSWTYQYAQDGTLASVVNPDSSRWSFSATGVLKAEYIEQLGAGVGPTFCDEPGLGQGHYEYSITHPSGAQAKFTFDLLRHYRVGMDFACTRDIPPHVVWTFQTPTGSSQLSAGDIKDILELVAGGMEWGDAFDFVKLGALFTEENPIHFEILEIPGYDRLRWPNYFDYFSLSNVLVSGPGIEAKSTQYNYEQVTRFGFCYPYAPCDFSGAPTLNPLPESKWVTVTKPDGSKDRHRFGVVYGANEGRLLESTTGSATTVLRSQATTFVQDSEVAGFGFPGRIGQSLRSEPQLGRVRPARLQVMSQDGETFSYAVNAFDVNARPSTITRSNSLGFSRQEIITYHDNTTKWVLGQTASVTCAVSIPASAACDGDIVNSATYDAATAMPLIQSSFGKLQQTLTYNADGTVATVKDGNNNVIMLSNWKRGIPQTIKYPGTPEVPAGATQSAVVNDNGWITSTTDENGYKTCYGYDAMGRINLVTYPSEVQTGVCDTSAWLATNIEFRPMTAGEWRPPGVAAGQWRQFTYRGSYQKVVYFDAMWRPILSNEYDAYNTLGTLRAISTSYDSNGRVAFQSYPSSDIVPAANGIWTFYDALDRVTQVKQDSEHGLLTTLTEYLPGFQMRVTNPRGYQTLTQYQAYDQPSYDFPTGITQFAGADTSATEIHRDAFGKPLRIRKRNADGSKYVDRHYVYDSHQQLCKAVEPETGATIMDYDGGGNLQWSASGLHHLNGTAGCDTIAGRDSGRKVTRYYDNRNRLHQIVFPNGAGDQTWEYWPDGLPRKIITHNDGPGLGIVQNDYTYNRRRLPTGESITQQGWYSWGLGYGYDANGNRSTQTYPTGLTISYAPNALGQATQARDQSGYYYASGASYYPNGAVKQFTYGNGIVHTMTQNARQLPARSTDSGSVVDFVYTYDQNGNTVRINDWARDGVNSGDALHIRYMTYDGLDRLTNAGSCSFGGDCWHRFTYDALDNLTSWKLAGVKDYASYVYDAQNRLGNIKNSAGATIVGLSYDLQGNLQNKNGQSYVFDYGNRLRVVTGKEHYRYDAHGRRIMAWDPITTQNILSQYSQSGQILYQEDYRKTIASENIYLAGSVIAIRDRSFSSASPEIKFQHTDALGSPVAVTNQAGAATERNSYEPYGAVIGKPSYQGIGYTGHVQDAATGLTYMQQRYYDPVLGIFLSVDPVTAYEQSISQFHRYRYANNNPYKFTDPDGRQSFRMGPVNPNQFKAQAESQRMTNEAKTHALGSKDSNAAVTGSGWTRPADHPYVVGREGTPVQPGNIEQGGRGEMLDNNVPGMHTMGTLHDAFVDTAVANGVPDQLANIPSMGGAYAIAAGAETVNMNVGIINSVLGTNIPKPFEHSHDQTAQEQAKPVLEEKR